MESIISGLGMAGTTLETDASLRMKNPPQPSRQALARGKVMVDLGSTFSPHASSQKTNLTSPSKRSHRSTACNESEDEMDCFSHQDSTPTKKSRAKENARSDLDVDDDKPRNAAKGKSRKAVSSTVGSTMTVEITRRAKPSPKKAASSSALQESEPSGQRKMPTERPKPKPAYEQPEEIEDDVAPRGLRKFPKPPSLSESSPTRRKRNPLPVSPISSTNESAKAKPAPSIRNGASKNKSKGQSKAMSSLIGVMLAPSRKTRRKSAPFPMRNISPPASTAQPRKEADDGLHHADVSSSSNSEDDLAMTSDDMRLTRGGRLPFPLSRTMWTSSRASGSGERGERIHESIGANELPGSLDEVSDEEANDSLFLDPDIDPSTLCPYCDLLLPSNPTPTLVALLKRAAAHPRSRRDPRPTNPFGRRAPLTVFVGVCQRHRFESIWLPKARRKGWKESIEWEGLGARVRRLKRILEDIINDADGSYSDEDDWVDGVELSAKDPRWGPRKSCVFWREMKRQVKKGGMKAVGGVRGQYDTFEKTQPGYYGELGSAIISQTLYTLFPPTSVDASKTHPLTPADFIQRILVPQVGLLLIRDDLGLSVEDALTTMRESVQYGVAMFPHGGAEGGDKDEEEMGIADQMVMEQAIRRRKELEAEEREERDALEREMERESRQRQGKGKGKAKKREKSRPEVIISQSMLPRSRPHPQPVAKPNKAPSQGPTALITTVTVSDEHVEISSDTTTASGAENQVPAQTVFSTLKRVDLRVYGKKHQGRVKRHQHPFKPTVSSGYSSREEKASCQSDSSAEIVEGAASTTAAVGRDATDENDHTPRPRRTTEQGAFGRVLNSGIDPPRTPLGETAHVRGDDVRTKKHRVWMSNLRSATPSDSSSSIEGGSPTMGQEDRGDFSWLIDDFSPRKGDLAR